MVEVKILEDIIKEIKEIGGDSLYRKVCSKLDSENGVSIDRIRSIEKALTKDKKESLKGTKDELIQEIKKITKAVDGSLKNEEISIEDYKEDSKAEGISYIIDDIYVYLGEKIIEQIEEEYKDTEYKCKECGQKIKGISNIKKKKGNDGRYYMQCIECESGYKDNYYDDVYDYSDVYDSDDVYDYDDFLEGWVCIYEEHNYEDMEKLDTDDIYTYIDEYAWYYELPTIKEGNN